MNIKEKDFLEAYDKMLRTIKRPLVMKTSDICKRVAENPAPRFYVSVDEALRQYRIFKRTGTLAFPRQSTRRMYAEIFRRYEEALEKYGSCSFKFSIMSQVIQSQAPCFYLEPCTAFKFYYRAMYHKRKRSKK